MSFRIAAILTAALFTFFLHAQTPISGTVKDAKTKEPLQGASVFAPQTTNGGATDGQGLFAFTLNQGSREVLISFIGYESVIVPAEAFSDTSKTNTVYLQPVVNTLKEMVVKKISSEDRKKFLGIFIREFIGQGKIAEKTKILNSDVLQFDMNADNTVLTVTADAPLQMINEKTGYQITYELVYFEHRIITERQKQILTTYFGYPFFKDIITEKKLDRKAVEQRRLTCYKGSTMHLIRSLFKGNCTSEGFVMRKFKRVPNPDYPSEEKIKRVAQEYIQQGKPMPMPHIDIYDKFDSTEANLVYERDGKKYFYFPDYLTVNFTAAGEELQYGLTMHFRHRDNQFSTLQLMSDKPLEIFSDGNYSDPELLVNYGYLGWKKMGEMLPFDYMPQ